MLSSSFISSRSIQTRISSRSQLPSIPNVYIVTKHLLNLLALLQFFPLTSFLRSLGPRLSIHNVIPPSETTRVVANETHMVFVMVFSAGPEGQEVVQAPRKVVTTVGINSLEQPNDDPDVHRQDVKFTSGKHPQDRDTDYASAEEEGLDRRGVFCSETERRRVRVVDLMDVLVKRAPMKRAMEPIVPGIFQDEEDTDLESHSCQSGERDAGVHSAVFGHRMEEPNLGELDGEV